MKPITKWIGALVGAAGASYAAYVAGTWLTYGRPRRAATKDAVDALLDSFMPNPDVREHHHVVVEAPADVTFAAAKTMRFDDSRVVRAIFKARELILQGAPDTTPRPTEFLEQMKSIGWGVLGEIPDRELVMGAVTKPWEANPVFRPIAPRDFAAFAEPDHVKIAWTLRATPRPDGGCLFQTETRAVATDPGARRKFRAYWALLSPGIILIRKAMLRPLAAAAARQLDHIEHQRAAHHDDMRLS